MLRVSPNSFFIARSGRDFFRPLSDLVRADLCPSHRRAFSFQTFICRSALTLMRDTLLDEALGILGDALAFCEWYQAGEMMNASAKESLF